MIKKVLFYILKVLVKKFSKLQAKLVIKGGFSLKLFPPGGENLTPKVSWKTLLQALLVT